jgi:hypothetical protein
MSGQFLFKAAVIVVLCSAAPGLASIAHAQQPPLGPGRGLPAPPPVADPAVEGVSPAEIERMFEAYAAMQAQDQLQLGSDQYPQFLARYKVLQDTRRREQQERNRLLQDLRRLTMKQAQPDDAELKERLKSLRDLDARSAVEIAKAREAIDQVLDARQQARFRLFEDQMERRKLDLLTRARVLRQTNRVVR